jgi:hypothetical protein
MSAPDSRWTEETLRLYRRYEREVVEAHDFCPWAARVRREGRLAERVLLHSDDERVEPSLDVIEALGRDADLALLIYPRFAGARDRFERFAARVREASIARRAPEKDPWVSVVFHPDAQPRMEEPERLIPYLRRTPDATIQFVRTAVLDRVRASLTEGTQFMDPRFLETETFQPRPPTLRERIAHANLTTTLRVGLDTLAAQIADIIRDREETHRRLELESPRGVEAASIGQ